MINSEYKLINKMMLSSDFNTVEKLKIDKTFFKIPECRDAFEYIRTYTKNINTLGFLPSEQLFRQNHPSFMILDEVKEPLQVLCEDLRVNLMQAQIDAIIEEAQGFRQNPYKALETLLGGTSTMLSQHTANTRLFKIEECGEELLDDYRQLKENKGIKGIPWPFPTMNEQTMGIKKEDWIVEYGRPGHGKTSLIIGALERIYRNYKVRIGVFNFEDSEWDLLRLFQAYRTNIDYFDLKRGALNEEDAKRYQESCLSLAKEAESGRLFFVENCPGSGISNISARIDEFNLDIVVINGVYFLKDNGAKKTDMEWKVITNISRNLKQLAKEKQVAIIGITQANRQTEQVAYADAFEQDCDALFKIEPVKRGKETKEMWTKISLQKVRGGGQPTDFCVYTRLGMDIREVPFPEEEIESTPVKIKKQENPFTFAPQKKKGLLG